MLRELLEYEELQRQQEQREREELSRIIERRLCGMTCRCIVCAKQYFRKSFWKAVES